MLGGGGDGSAAGEGCQLPIQLPMHPHILAFACMLTSELQRESRVEDAVVVVVPVDA